MKKDNRQVVMVFIIRAIYVLQKKLQKETKMTVGVNL